MWLEYGAKFVNSSGFLETTIITFRVFVGTCCILLMLQSVFVLNAYSLSLPNLLLAYLYPEAVFSFGFTDASTLTRV